MSSENIKESYELDQTTPEDTDIEVQDEELEDTEIYDEELVYESNMKTSNIISFIDRNPDYNFLSSTEPYIIKQLSEDEEIVSALDEGEIVKLISDKLNMNVHTEDDVYVYADILIDYFDSNKTSTKKRQEMPKTNRTATTFKTISEGTITADKVFTGTLLPERKRSTRITPEMIGLTAALLDVFDSDEEFADVYFDRFNNPQTTSEWFSLDIEQEFPIKSRELNNVINRLEKIYGKGMVDEGLDSLNDMRRISKVASIARSANKSTETYTDNDGNVYTVKDKNGFYWIDVVDSNNTHITNGMVPASSAEEAINDLMGKNVEPFKKESSKNMSRQAALRRAFIRQRSASKKYNRR